MKKNHQPGKKTYECPVLISVGIDCNKSIAIESVATPEMEEVDMNWDS